MYSSLIFILVAVVIAFLHMIAPDHWLPLTALSVKRGYNSRKIKAISAILGFLHGSTSVLLSLFILFLGIDLFGVGKLKEISLIVLVAVAIYIVVNSTREGKSSSKIENTSLLVSIFPDPAFLPIIIVSDKFGTVYISVISFAFILTSILSLMLVLIVVMAGISDRASKINPVTVDRIVALALALTAVYIYFFG